jgi:hypothetical protein
VSEYAKEAIKLVMNIIIFNRFNDHEDVCLVLANFWRTLVLEWRKLNPSFTLFDPIMGRQHIRKADVKKFNSKNPEYKNFFMEDPKKTKDLMMKYLAIDRPLISLSINPPSLLNHQTKPSHALVYIVKEGVVREGINVRDKLNLFK